MTMGGYMEQVITKERAQQDQFKKSFQQAYYPNEQHAHIPMKSPYDFTQKVIRLQNRDNRGLNLLPIEARQNGYYMLDSSYLNASDPNSMRNFGKLRNAVYNFQYHLAGDLEYGKRAVNPDEVSRTTEVSYIAVRPNDYTKNISDNVFSPGISGKFNYTDFINKKGAKTSAKKMSSKQKAVLDEEIKSFLSKHSKRSNVKSQQRLKSANATSSSNKNRAGTRWAHMRPVSVAGTRTSDPKNNMILYGVQANKPASPPEQMKVRSTNRSTVQVSSENKKQRFLKLKNELDNERKLKQSLKQQITDLKSEFESRIKSANGSRK